MKVRCKFKCDSITLGMNGGSVILTPVIQGSPENELFYKWTPGGKLELMLLSIETASMFIPGQQYYIDISEVEVV